MSVYFLSLFQSKRGEFSLLQTGSSLIFAFFFLRHTIQNFNFG